jgi:hypothetical protein
MKKTTKGAAFLQALNVTAEPEPSASSEPAPAPAPSVAKHTPPRVSTRAGLKHIGGYFGRDDVEKFAVLRARLDLDNSQLIKLAIDELYKKHQAKRAFGDD